uniref:DUF4218 domain-containing protein n=1 Tax=Tanacetum cinerariifolium TaxID=118510 RepID=A0A699IZE1_TANCI|nr:hypothetical protein [Tanacetum cinerariifolium]
MMYLVIYLPLEALEGRPIRPQWMFSFERFMKKLKGYVRNKAKPEGSIAERYVTEEALTFSSHYFWDVTTKFNHHDHNVDPYDDIIDDEDAIPHDLAYSDDEDLVNVDDDDGVNMSADVARGHDDDGDGDDRPPTHHIPTGCDSCFINRGTLKPNLGGRKAGMLHTHQETRNLGLKKITNDKGPVPIRFEWDDKKTLMPLGEHASHWYNYLRELIKEMPLYYPSWKKVPTKRKATIVTKIRMQFDLKPHMQSQRCTCINVGIQQHLQKLYNTNKASLKAAHWVINPKTGTYDVESIKQ